MSKIYRDGMSTTELSRAIAEHYGLADGCWTGNVRSAMAVHDAGDGYREHDHELVIERPVAIDAAAARAEREAWDAARQTATLDRRAQLNREALRRLSRLPSPATPMAIACLRPTPYDDARLLAERSRNGL